MDENAISKVIVDCAMEVHRELGWPGLLEGVYEEALACELKLRGMKVERQRPVPVIHKGFTLATPLRFDLRVNDLVLVDPKAVLEWNPVFGAQMLTFLRAHPRTAPGARHSGPQRQPCRTGCGASQACPCCQPLRPSGPRSAVVRGQCQDADLSPPHQTQAWPGHQFRRTMPEERHPSGCERPMTAPILILCACAPVRPSGS